MAKRILLRPLTLLFLIASGVTLAVVLDLAGVGEGLTFAITMAALGVAFIAENLVVLRLDRGRTTKKSPEPSVRISSAAGAMSNNDGEAS